VGEGGGEGGVGGGGGDGGGDALEEQALQLEKLAEVKNARPSFHSRHQFGKLILHNPSPKPRSLLRFKTLDPHL